MFPYRCLSLEFSCCWEKFLFGLCFVFTYLLFLTFPLFFFPTGTNAELSPSDTRSSLKILAR